MTTPALHRPVLAEALLPARTGAARLPREIALVGGGLLALTLLAQVAIPLPMTPVPLTLGTFGALLVGAALGPRHGLLAIGSYAGLAGAGAPVLAGWSSAGIATASFGYVIGYVLAGIALGAAARRGADRSVPLLALAASGATLLVYLPGTLWLAAVTGAGLETALAMGVVPFLIGDVIKATAVAILLPTVWRGVRAVENRS